MSRAYLVGFLATMLASACESNNSNTASDAAVSADAPNTNRCVSRAEVNCAAACANIAMLCPAGSTSLCGNVGIPCPSAAECMSGCPAMADAMPRVIGCGQQNSTCSGFNACVTTCGGFPDAGTVPGDVPTTTDVPAAMDVPSTNRCLARMEIDCNAACANLAMLCSAGSTSLCGNVGISCPSAAECMRACPSMADAMPRVVGCGQQNSTCSGFNACVNMCGGFPDAGM